MRKLCITSALLIAAVISQSAIASDELSKKYNCAACHKVDAKMIGPSYKDIAAKYKDGAGAAEELAAKIKSGGSGAWGQIPMPPNPTVPDEDIATIVTWILSQ